MLTPGDVVELELGAPSGSEAGGPNLVQVVPLTRTLRDDGAEVVIEPDEDNGLDARSAAQCQHMRAVAVGRVTARIGNVGPVMLQQIRHTVAVILDI